MQSDYRPCLAAYGVFANLLAGAAISSLPEEEAEATIIAALANPEFLVPAVIGAAALAVHFAQGETELARAASNAVSSCNALENDASRWLFDTLGAAADYALAQGYTALAQDPPDLQLHSGCSSGSSVFLSAAAHRQTGFSPQVVSDINSLLSNLEQQIAFLRVIPTTVNRVSGAVAAGNAVWQAQQAQAVQKYASEIVPLLQAELSIESTLTNDLVASGRFPRSPPATWKMLLA